MLKEKLTKDEGNWAYYDGSLLSRNEMEMVLDHMEVDEEDYFFASGENTLPANKIKVYTRLADDPSKSNTGGDYYFYYCLYYIGAGVWEKRYYSSANFDYCNVHGMFQDCRSCMGMGKDGCSDEFEYLSTAEVEELIEGLEYELEENHYGSSEYPKQIVIEEPGA